MYVNKYSEQHSALKIAMKTLEELHTPTRFDLLPQREI